MPTFAETAIAAHTAALTAERDALVAAARSRLVAVFTDSTGKLLFDPKAWTAVFTDVPNKIVVFATTPDVPPSHVMVKGDVVTFARQDAGAWVNRRADNQPFPPITSLRDAGAALAAG